MIIYYGTKKKLKHVKQLGRMRCTNCGHEVDASLTKEGGYFHIFFIPVFPVFGYKMIFCPNCGIMKKLTSEEFKEMKESNP
ncbi:zinc-ribbon family protein [Oscillospiraceae bacterium]|nr:zinc ribbon domain-containing protein [Saccharofermentans sp.]SMC34734.1 zinc-ribbon family protein [Oscillospiraceae bacterium]